jgi:guanine deaminase
MTATLLQGGHVLSPDGSALVRADVLVRDGTIAAVGTGLVAEAERVDATGCLVLPGFANGHTHAHGALARGAVPDRVSLEGFLACAPALTGQRSVDDLRLSATLAAVELARKGCTSCMDMAGQLPRPTVDGILAVGEAYAQVGLRAVVAPMVSDRTLYQAYPALTAGLAAGLQAQARAIVPPHATELLETLREAQRRWPFDRRLVQLGVGPAIPLHCSDELLAGCGAIAREFDVPLQTHLLESRLQALAQGSGESAVQRLLRLGCLGPHTSLAHGVWLDDADLQAIAASGATLVHNPASNLRLGSGVARLRHWLDAGVRMAIGTDATNTSDGQNMFEATRLASYLSRVATPDWAQWVDAAQAFALATQGGSVAAGQRADLVLLDLAQPHFVPLRDPLRQVVFGESGAGVRRVLVAGRTVFADGRVIGVDEAALRTLAQERAAALDTACAPAAEWAAAALPAIAAFCGAVPRFPREESP